MTAFYTRLAPEHYKLGLDVLTDMLFHSKFDAEEIEREKGTIIQEIRMYDDQPMALAPRTFQQMMYPTTRSVARSLARTRRSTR